MRRTKSNSFVSCGWDQVNTDDTELVRRNTEYGKDMEFRICQSELAFN